MTHCCRCLFVNTKIPREHCIGRMIANYYFLKRQFKSVSYLQKNHLPMALYKGLSMCLLKENFVVRPKIVIVLCIQTTIQSAVIANSIYVPCKIGPIGPIGPRVVTQETRRVSRVARASLPRPPLREMIVGSTQQEPSFALLQVEVMLSCVEPWRRHRTSPT